MGWLASPCVCGYSLDDNEDGTERSCRACGRRYVNRQGFVEQVTAKSEIRQPDFCGDNRIVGESCPHCPGGVAKAQGP